MSVRAYLEIAAGLIVAIALGLYTWHERSVGAAAVHTADAQAQQEARKRADAETQLNNERATKAEEQAAYAQTTVDRYRADHPEQPIRLCHADSRLPVPAPGSGAVASAASPSTGPAAVREVQDGAPGPDIGPGVDELVRSAARLAVLYGNLQQRQHPSPLRTSP